MLFDEPGCIRRNDGTAPGFHLMCLVLGLESGCFTWYKAGGDLHLTSDYG
jgi:hypothetical protein